MGPQKALHKTGTRVGKNPTPHKNTTNFENRILYKTNDNVATVTSDIPKKASGKIANSD